MDLTSKSYRLRPDADTDFDPSEEWYDRYGAHVSTEHHGDIVIQAIDYDSLHDDDDEITSMLRQSYQKLTDDEAAELIEQARRVGAAADSVEALLSEAVAAYQRGDLSGTLDALHAASQEESEHGDDPATRALAAQLLLERVTRYRVYYAPEGEGLTYCGDYETLAEAQEAAESDPAGLDKSLWDTARAAGHCAGMEAPPSVLEEDDEPISWHGEDGWHCVCRVVYEEIAE